ncbi:MAG: membrane dipeptidase [Candidatus Paceibacterota bacterium]
MTAVFDMHQDMLLPEKSPEIFEYGNLDQTGFQQIENSPISLVVASGFPYPKDGKHFDTGVFSLIEEDLQDYIEYCDGHTGWHMVTTDALLEKSVCGEGIGILFHIEGLNAFRGTPEQWEMFEDWYRRGWRSVGMVWNYKNALGGGADSDVGLSTLGSEFLEWCEAHHMLIDTAHMNEKTFRQTLDVVEGPLVATHANARALCERPRNFSAEQIRAIGERGGVVGVFFSRNFLVSGGGGATIDTIIDHIQYIEEHGGKEAVVLGTDFGGNDSPPMEGMKTVRDLPNLFKALRSRGYSEDDCQRIGWRNAYRVLKDVLPRSG